MPSSFHLSTNPDWYTPRAYIEAARTVLGGIDLDPASDEMANRRVQATRFYSHHGAERTWKGRIFVNPPGHLYRQFWCALMDEWEVTHVTAAIWIGYSLEQLLTLQRLGDRTPLSPLHFPMCIPHTRMRFTENRAQREKRWAALRRKGKPITRAKSPSHGNYIVYIGDRPRTFQQVFEVFGQVVNVA